MHRARTYSTIHHLHEQFHPSPNIVVRRFMDAMQYNLHDTSTNHTGVFVRYTASERNFG